jgi:uncharacterized protein
MTTVRAYIQRHPVLIYYILVFAISWGGILLVVGPGGIPGTPEEVESTYPLVILVLLAGPSVSGILMTGLVHGRTGLRTLLSRLLRWRVGWYAVALLAAPLTVAATLFPLSLFSPIFLPDIVTTDDRASLLLTGIAVGLVGGFLEELGWTGFAIPEMRRRYSILGTGLFVGFLWGTWHLLITFWMSGDATGAPSLALFLPSIVASYGELPAYRVLMVWVYDRTQSLLMAVLMHASLIFSTLFVLNSATSGAPAVIWHLLLAVVLWVVVAAVALANGGQLSPKGKSPAGIGPPQLTPR